MIQVAFPAVARSARLAPRAGWGEPPALPLSILVALAIWTSVAALLHPLLYADIFSHL